MNSFEILNHGYQSNHLEFSYGSGSHLYDESETAYIDMALGSGSLILGHAPSAIVNTINKQSQLGTLFLQNNNSTQQLSQRVCDKIPKHLTKHIYCNSGSEATQRAVRIARAATNKTVIASFQGGWHGMNEWTLHDDGGRFGINSSSLPSLGIPTSVMNETLSLPYNNEECWSILERHADVIAAVIIEPLQGSNPQPDIKSFLKKLEQVCNQLNIILIFDEIITGFRLHPGGGASYFDIKPDIATYGKILGGGLPIGLVTISEAIHSKTFLDTNKTMLTGGTFSANPLSTATGTEVLSHLNAASYETLNSLGTLFRQLTNEKFEHYNIPFRARGLGSISRIYFTDKPVRNRAERDLFEIDAKLQIKFRQLLWQSRVIWPANGIICQALCQSNQLIEEITNHIIDAAKNLSNR
jgi:glutamate-1-semialdehyde 2,1-aminomutase